MAKSFDLKKAETPNEIKLNVLDVGAGYGLAKVIYPNDNITTLDCPGSKADIEVDLETADFLKLDLPKFDIILCSHVLDHITPRAVDGVLAKLFEATVPNGQIVVKVPSVEWAAEQIASEKATIAVLFHLWGAHNNKYDYHKWGYTIGGLRNNVKRAGYIIGKAGVGHYEIVVNDVVYPAQETYVIGIKPKDDE